MGRKAAALIAYMLVLLSSLSAISADDFGTFFTSIINASYHNDFAYGLFPISFWGEFGLNDMELIKGHESKVYSRVEAGFSQRRLRQDPVTGDIIEDYGRLMVKDGQYASSEYSVVFSDGSVGFQQSLVRNPDPSRGDMLSISISLGMRWEQAFASFYDIRMGNYGGVFNSLFFKPDGYDSAKASSTPGTPDLAGNLYFLTNKLELGIAFFDRDTDYLTPSGYYAEIDIEAAPWWLANSLDAFDIRTDYLRLGLSGSYDYTILSQKQKDGFNLYSLVLNTRINAQFLIGQAIPRHAMKVSYRGKDIPQRTMIMDIYASLAVNGPEPKVKATYPYAVAFAEMSVASGQLANTSGKENKKSEIYASLGIRIEMNLLGLFKAYFQYAYDFGNSIPGYPNRHDISFGAYLTAVF